MWDAKATLLLSYLGREHLIEHGSCDNLITDVSGRPSRKHMLSYRRRIDGPIASLEVRNRQGRYHERGIFVATRLEPSRMVRTATDRSLTDRVCKGNLEQRPVKRTRGVVGARHNLVFEALGKIDATVCGRGALLVIDLMEPRRAVADIYVANSELHQVDSGPLISGSRRLNLCSIVADAFHANSADDLHSR